MTQDSFNHAAQATGAEANFLPHVVVKTNQGERGYDLYSRLMEDNIIMVQGPVNAGMASIIVAQLLFLGDKLSGQGKTITMNIDSPGGSVDAGMSIYDTMNFVQAEYGVAISTVGLGMNMSMGSFLLCAGTPGYRCIMPNSDHMVHQPSAGSQGKVSDMGITQDVVDELKQRLTMLYVAHTKMNYEQAKQICHHDSFLRAEECLELGLVDKILYPDEIMAAKKATGAQYAPGIEEHLKKLSEFQRTMNISAKENRRTADTERGPHTDILKKLEGIKAGPTAP